MGEWADFPLPDGSYSDDTRPWSQQDVVNYLPTLAEMPGTRSRLKLACVPGLSPFSTVGFGPHRGGRDVEGKVFVVSGGHLYRVYATGLNDVIGAIPGTGFVSMTHNQIAGGNELVIGTRDNSYVYNTVTGTLSASGVGLSSVDFLGQMILGLSTDRRFWRHSALADAMTYSDLDVYPAESAPDRLVGGVASQSEWLAFGERTIETFVNSPTENASFQRMSGAVVEKGCANGNTIRRLDNSVFWLGDDLIVYRMQGYQPVPVSTKAMAAAFRACDPAKAFAFTYEDHGYVIYYLTFQDGQTWGYDVTNQRWHRRESFGLDRWRLNTLFKSNGEWYGGDYASGSLYRLVWGYMYEGESAPIPRRLRSGVMHNNGNRVFVHGLKILMDSGLAVSSDAPEPPTPPGVISISGEFDGGTVGTDYTSGPLVASNAFEPLHWSMSAMPAGLSMSSDGTITGTPTASGEIAGDVTVTDRYGRTATVSRSINVVYGSPLAVGYTSSIAIYSGSTSDYPLAYTISDENVTTDCEIAFSDGGEYMAVSNVNAPYFRLYQRSPEGAYLETELPLDVMPASRVAAVALTSDAGYLFISEATVLRIYKRVGTTFQQIYSKATGGFSLGAKWSPSGEYLAATINSVADGYLGIFRRNGDAITQLAFTEDWNGQSVAWNKAGDRLAYARRSQGIRVISVSGDVCTKLNTTTGSSPGNSQVQWSIDGQHLYLGGNIASPAGVYLWVYQWNGAVLTRLADPVAQPPGIVLDIDLSKDGRLLSVTGSDYAYLYAVDGASLTKIAASGIAQTAANQACAFLESSDHWLP